MPERRHTHTQYADQATPEVATCRPGYHNYVWDEDEDGEVTAAVCTRCGESDVEPSDEGWWDPPSL